HDGVATRPAEPDRVFLAALPIHARGNVALEVAARGAELKEQVRIAEAQIDITADRLEAVRARRLEDALHVDIAAHRLQLQRSDAGGIEADVAADAVALDVSDVAPYRDVAAD